MKYIRLIKMLLPLTYSHRTRYDSLILAVTHTHTHCKVLTSSHHLRFSRLLAFIVSGSDSVCVFQPYRFLLSGPNLSASTPPSHTIDESESPLAALAVRPGYLMSRPFLWLDAARWLVKDAWWSSLRSHCRSEGVMSSHLSPLIWS